MRTFASAWKTGCKTSAAPPIKIAKLSEMTLSVAVDIGGTFTDLVAVDDSTGEIFVEKSSSSATDPIAAVLDVIAKANVPPENVNLFLHGTTVATNALIQRSGTRVAFITNRGFRDVIFIQNANRRDLYSLSWRKPRPLASRFDCLEIDCRVDSQGEPVVSLNANDVDAAIAHIEREGIKAVAISFLFSYVNPVHELELELRLRDAIPDLAISLSHLVYPRWRENDRGHTTIADAYLKRMFRRYTNNLARGLERAGARSEMLIMKSNGGVVDVAAAADQPVNYLVSGPVGGVLGGAHFAKVAGLNRIMTIDIGGTSCDVSLLVDGRPSRSANFELELGIPICSPMVDIHTIGAGGGSVAWIDAGGLLRVGPRSSGSVPGPACYGQGGSEPTLTDANLLLGRLNPESFAGGDISLSVELARAAMQRVSKELDLSVEETSSSIIAIANHSMVNALKVISVEQGIDPRDFAIVAFGGAGALHAADIAQILGVRKVLVPPHPGNTSAFGLMTAGLRSDLAATLLVRSDDTRGLERLNAALAPLRVRTLRLLQREGNRGKPLIEQKLEMRYFGQNHHREIEIGDTCPLDQLTYAAALESFHTDHREHYGYEQRADVIEIVGVVVTAVGDRPQVLGRFHEEAGTSVTATEGKRTVYFADTGWLDATILQRHALGPGVQYPGPLVVEERLSTTLVDPNATLTAHASGSLLIQLREEAYELRR